MNPYTFSLTLGGIGLGVMALSGFAQAAHVGHGHGNAAHRHGHGGHGHSGASRLVALPQPRVAFSVLVGFGAAGVILRPSLPEPSRLVASLGAGGESYFRYKQIDRLPQLGPAIADGLSHAKLLTISSGGEGAPEATTSSITGVIQTVLAAQLVGRAGVLDGNGLPEPATRR